MVTDIEFMRDGFEVLEPLTPNQRAIALFLVTSDEATDAAKIITAAAKLREQYVEVEGDRTAAVAWFRRRLTVGRLSFPDGRDEPAVGADTRRSRRRS